MSTVIRVENLSKKYIIGHEKKEQYTALRDVISNRVQSVFRKKTPQEAAAEEFYALQDVSFDIEQGERVGIIGRNGAGKSTLLKILSRITEPTSGRISIRGRVASLLEVGTGFHPELTGRENIFLNGAILGMSRAEIKQKFDEIVDFSEVERFLDTPVKRYSSGMYVRLAFAVAAHLEPEILIVDEVLAVGDAQFQRKCLGKMEDVSKNQGRTVLFVSHNMAAISNFCNKGVFMQGGRVAAQGLCSDIITAYVSNSIASVKPKQAVQNIDKPSITDFHLDPKALAKNILSLTLGFKSPFPFNPIAGVVVSTITDTPIFGTNNAIHTQGYFPSTVDEGSLKLEIDNMPLHSGTYKLSLWLSDSNQTYDSKRDIAIFDFISPTMLPNHISPDVIGHTNVAGRWTLQEANLVNEETPSQA